MANTNLLGSFGDVSNSSLMFRNKIINGNFDIWQRGTSQTSAGYGSDDRWNNDHNGSTKTTSQQAFTVGQTDVPGNPRFWSRTVVTSAAGSGNYCVKSQRIEDARTCSAQTVTVSFWAKADASKNIAIEFLQYFGTGGSPSATVTGIGVTTYALTTSWQKFTITTTIPSVSGKTFGTNNDSYFSVAFWFDAGSSLNSRTNSLGQQSGTFDIAQVQLEAGPVATPFEQRPIGLELALCQRYFTKSYELGTAPGTGTTTGQITYSATSTGGGGGGSLYISFKQQMRAAPATITFWGAHVNNTNNWRNNNTAATGTMQAAFVSSSGFSLANLGLAMGLNENAQGHWTADAEL